MTYDFYIPKNEKAEATQINFKRRKLICFMSKYGYRLGGDKAEYRLTFKPLFISSNKLQTIQVKLYETSYSNKSKYISIYVHDCSL